MSSPPAKSVILAQISFLPANSPLRFGHSDNVRSTTATSIILKASAMPVSIRESFRLFDSTHGTTPQNSCRLGVARAQTCDRGVVVAHLSELIE